MTFFSDPFVQITFLALCIGVALFIWVWRAETQRNPLVERLENTTAGSQNADAFAGNILKNANTAHLSSDKGLTAQIARIGIKLAGNSAAQAKLAKSLIQAGYRHPHAVGLFVAIKTLIGIVAVLLIEFGWLQEGQRLTMVGLAAGLMGYFVGGIIPELLVKMRANKRAEQLSRSIPDALDLMVICAEAGLPLGRILKVVSRELGLSAPIMADELRVTEAELQIVSDRTIALKNLAERTQVSTIDSMVSSLLQAERYGTPLAQALRTIAEESRTTLILTLEEKAGKLPAQLSLPLMTMILPPIVALMATPALVRVIRMLSE